jgi:hypothetical protein
VQCKFAAGQAGNARPASEPQTGNTLLQENLDAVQDNFGSGQTVERRSEANSQLNAITLQASQCS